MWEDYFHKAKVHGVNNTPEGLEEMIASGKHNILISDTLNPVQVEKDYGGMKFDVIIEDANHVFVDTMTLYKNFKDKVAPGGVYIIEDVDAIDQRRPAFEAIDLLKPVDIIDRRAVKGRFDDVLVVVGGVHNRERAYAVIDAKFNALLSEVSDMQGHMVSIFNHAVQCKRIVEFGVFDCTSTWALLASKPSWMRSYDIYRHSAVDVVERAARNADLDFRFMNESSIEAQIEPCDLLLIDSFHSYEQLSKELSMHSGKVSKYMILHDTTIFANVDQTGLGRGLWPAIQEFLDLHPEWRVKERFEHCYGLTILERA
jgi:hypothetical protein